MKTLDSDEYVTTEIDEAGRQRFEAFLDRNFPGWRDSEMLKEHNAGTVTREWRVGVDRIERRAFFRKQYVEIRDIFIDDDDVNENGPMIHFLKHRICDIDGDLTPVAQWKSR